MTRLLRPLSKGQVTLPAAFRRRLGIGDQTILSCSLKTDRIELIPVQVTSQGVSLRNYSPTEIDAFLKEDKIDKKTARKVERLLRGKG